MTCDTAAIRDEIVARGLVPADRLVVAPVGVGRAYSSEPDPAADRAAARLVASPDGAIELLHVGSTIPRKRIDVLLRVFAALRRERAGAASGPRRRAVHARAGRLSWTRSA